MTTSPVAGSLVATFEFDMTPPRRGSGTFEGRQDTTILRVKIRRRGEIAEVFVARQYVATVRRRPLRDWLQAPTGLYLESPLMLRATNMGVWLEITDHTASMMLHETARSRIVDTLGV